jgi:hypothetical protein
MARRARVTLAEIDVDGSVLTLEVGKRINSCAEMMVPDVWWVFDGKRVTRRRAWSLLAQAARLDMAEIE